MAFNGLGQFQLLYDWVADRNNGIKILATRMMGQEEDIATGLSSCVTVDGQSTITATIPFNNQQITLLASSTSRTGAMNLGQFVDGSAIYASASGTNAYVADLDPAITAIPNGLTAHIYFPNANTAAATATLDLNGVGARNIVIGNAVLASPGDIQPGMAIVVARGSTWQYFGSSAPKGVFNLANGSYLATGASADVNTSYMVDCTGTARTIYLSSTPATGDTVPLTIFGTNNCVLWASGNNVYGTTATIDTAGSEGFLIPRYTGSGRGWVW